MMLEKYGISSESDKRCTGCGMPLETYQEKKCRECEKDEEKRRRSDPPTRLAR